MADDDSDAPSGRPQQADHVSTPENEPQSGGAHHLSVRDHGILEQAIRSRVSRMIGEAHPTQYSAPRQEDDAAFDPRLNPERDELASRLPGTDKAITYRQVLLQALIDPDPRRHREVIADLSQMAIPMQTLAIHLFTPVASQLGERWCEDETDFIQVAVASTRLSMIINHLSHIAIRPIAEPRAERRVLLARTRRAMHTIGVAIVASCFRDMGWVVDGGIDMELDDSLYARLSATPYQMLGISVDQVDDIGECADTIRRIQTDPMTNRVKIAVGGPAVVANPAAFNAMGADIVARSALQVVQYAERLAS